MHKDLVKNNTKTAFNYNRHGSNIKLIDFCVKRDPYFAANIKNKQLSGPNLSIFLNNNRSNNLANLCN